MTARPLTQFSSAQIFRVAHQTLSQPIGQPQAESQTEPGWAGIENTRVASSNLLDFAGAIGTELRKVSNFSNAAWADIMTHAAGFFASYANARRNGVDVVDKFGARPSIHYGSVELVGEDMISGKLAVGEADSFVLAPEPPRNIRFSDRVTNLSFDLVGFSRDAEGTWSLVTIGPSPAIAMGAEKKQKLDALSYDSLEATEAALKALLAGGGKLNLKTGSRARELLTQISAGKENKLKEVERLSSQNAGDLSTMLRRAAVSWVDEASFAQLIELAWPQARNAG